MSSPIPDPGRVPDGPDFTDLPDEREAAPDTLAVPDRPGDDGSIEPRTSLPASDRGHAGTRRRSRLVPACHSACAR